MYITRYLHYICTIQHISTTCNERQEDRKHKGMPHGVKGNLFLLQVTPIKCISRSCTTYLQREESRLKAEKDATRGEGNKFNLYSNQMHCMHVHTPSTTRVKRKAQEASSCSKLCTWQQLNALVYKSHSCAELQTKPEKLQLANTAHTKCDCVQAPGTRQSFPRAIVVLWSS